MADKRLFTALLKKTYFLSPLKEMWVCLCKTWRHVLELGSQWEHCFTFARLFRAILWHSELKAIKLTIYKYAKGGNIVITVKQTFVQKNNCICHFFFSGWMCRDKTQRQDSRLLYKVLMLSATSKHLVKYKWMLTYSLNTRTLDVSFKGGYVWNRETWESTILKISC